VARVVLGENIERGLRDPTSPLSMMLERARGEFMQAARAFIESDLSNPDGIKQARSLQAQVQRYADLCTWLTQGQQDAADAELMLSDVDSAETETISEELKDQIYGNRDKPVPDAQ